MIENNQMSGNCSSRPTLHGHVLIEEELLGRPTGTFTKRYLISFPFCGLKWFKQSPDDIRNYHNLLMLSNNNCGWVYGGGILPHEVRYDHPIHRKRNTLYPFFLTIKSVGLTNEEDREEIIHSLIIRLATEEEETRQQWVNEIKISIQQIYYITICLKNNTLPSTLLFETLRDHDDDTFQLINYPLTSSSYHIIEQYYSKNKQLMLHSLQLENIGLTDSFMKNICNIIFKAEFLGILSLAGNFITSKGILQLIDVLHNKKYITEVNLSQNQIGNSCMGRLCEVLASLNELKVLNLAANNITNVSIKSMARYLATYNSRLTRINFSHNLLGDGIGGIISILMNNIPSKLIEIDLSFCNLTSNDIKNLIKKLLNCKTLEKLNLYGNNSIDPNILEGLMKAITKHHELYQQERYGNGMILNIGSINKQTINSSESLSLKKMKLMMLNISDIGLIKNLILRRRLLYHQQEDMPINKATTSNTSPTKHFSSSQFVYRTNNGIEMEINDLFKKYHHPIIEFEMIFHSYILSSNQLLEELSKILKCDIGQLLLLAMIPITEMNQNPSFRQEKKKDSNLYHIIFTITECLPNRLIIHQNNSYIHSLKKIFGTTKEIFHYIITNTINPVYEENLNTIRTKQTSLLLYDDAHVSSVETILKAFKDIESKTSSTLQHFLRIIGVSRVRIQYWDEKYTNNSTIDTIDHMKHSRTIDVKIKNAGMYAHEIDHQHMPPISPVDLSMLEGYGAPEDTDDDEYFDLSLRNNELYHHQQQQQQQYENIENISQDHVFHNLQEEEEEEEQSHAIDDEVDIPVTEAHIHRITQQREHRANNERICQAVRQLYSEKYINSAQAKFWEGAVGNIKHKDFTRNMLRLALHPEAGIFHSIHFRLQLYDAMFQRDIIKLNNLLLNMNKSEHYDDQGGHALVYAQRLRSEMLGLQKRWLDVTAMATSYRDYNMVEDYLLACGKLGYSGTEMFAAVDLRQKLISKAVKKTQQDVISQMRFIKHRAFFSNMMISRDMEALDSKLDELHRGYDEDLNYCAETIAADQLVTEWKTIQSNLEIAVESQNVDMIDKVLSVAAYNYFYSPIIDKLVQVLNEISRQPASTLLYPIVTALRMDNISQLELSFANVYKMGFKHPAMDLTLCTKILERKIKLQQREIVRNKLIKECVSLRNGFSVNAVEIMHLLRRANELQLEDDPALAPHMKSMARYSRQFAGVLKQERAIQAMIDNNQTEALAKLLLGRGAGKLVMSAPSQYVQDEWMKYLQGCCDSRFRDSIMDADGNFDEKAVFFTGTMEKAARNDQGLVRGWRQRFFVLHTTILVYFTKPRGERKGWIRVLGGGVRRMDPEETGGRPFCIELEEGRDISLINPDILEEARKHVMAVKSRQVERALQKGMRMQSLELITKCLQLAADLELVLNMELVIKARRSMEALKERNLKKDLYFAAKLAPRGMLDELIALANRLNVDTRLETYRTVKALASQSELNQYLHRARGALEFKDESIFLKTFTAISRFDSNSFTNRQRYQVAALIMQHMGYRILCGTLNGNPISSSIRPAKAALNICSRLLVETEPMDLARLVVILSSQSSFIPQRAGSFSSYHTAPGVNAADIGFVKGSGQQVSGIGAYVEEISSSISNNSAQYVVTKFKQLRFSSSYASKGLSIAAAFQSRKKNISGEEVLVHQLTPLQKSVLKYESPPPIDPHLHLEAFKILLVLMGDKPLNSLSRPRRGSVLRQKPSDINVVLLDLLDAAVSRYPIMRNELYFQLVKQMIMNPNRQSLYKGWILMSIYLHAFAPTRDAAPFIAHFIKTSLEQVEEHLHLLILQNVAHITENASLLEGRTRAGTLPRRRSSGVKKRSTQTYATMRGQSISSLPVKRGTMYSGGGFVAGGLNPDAVGQGMRSSLISSLGMATGSDEEIDAAGERNLLAWEQSQIESVEELSRIIRYCSTLIDMLAAYTRYDHQDDLKSSEVKADMAVGDIGKKGTGVTAAASAVATADAARKKKFNRKASSEMWTSAEYEELNRGNFHEMYGTVSIPLLATILEQRVLHWEVVLMSGSVFRFSLPYGQCDTPASLLLHLYDRLLPEDNFFQQMHHSYQVREGASSLGEQLAESILGDDLAVTGGAPRADDSDKDQEKQSIKGDMVHPTSSYFSIQSKINRVYELFRGFSFYKVFESDFAEEDENIDLQNLHVQPELERMVHYSTDIQWHMLLKQLNGQEHETSLPQEQQHIVDRALRLNAFSNSGETNRLLLRRTVGSVVDAFTEDFKIFGNHISDTDVAATEEMWIAWLQGDLLRPLPQDHVRMDILYAEDTRYVNSRLYPLTDESFHYLLAMQLAICWVDIDPAAWADADDDVIEGSSLAIRPCYKIVPKYELLIVGQARELRASMTAEKEVLEGHLEDTQDPDDSTSSENELENLYYRAGSRTSSDVESEESSEYVSSDSEDEDVEPTKKINTITEDDLIAPGIFRFKDEVDSDFLDELLQLLGVDQGSLDKEVLIALLVQIHGIALKASIPITSPKFRYMMKRAYLSYLRCASRFYGHYFASATLGLETPSDNLRKSMSAGANDGNSIASSAYTKESAAAEVGSSTEVLVAISVSGFVLLDPDVWTVRFSVPLWDIQDFQLVTSSDVDATEDASLLLTISGMEIALYGEKIYEILEMIKICSYDALGRGFFPYASNGTNEDWFNVNSSETTVGANQSKAGIGNAASSYMLSNSPGTAVLSDAKYLLRQHMNQYPLLPRPPIPHGVERAIAGYFEAPKSQRELIAQERAEEERVEMEMARLALEAQAERNERQIQQGRADMKRYQSAGGNEDDDSDNEGGGGTDGQHRPSQRRRRNRSVFKSIKTSEEVREQMQRERLDAVVCGVSQKSTSAFKVPEYQIPSIPIKIGGKIRINALEKRRMDQRPIIQPSSGHEEFYNMPIPSKSLDVGNEQEDSNESKHALTNQQTSNTDQRLIDPRLQSLLMDQVAIQWSRYQHMDEAVDIAVEETTRFMDEHSMNAVEADNLLLQEGWKQRDDDVEQSAQREKSVKDAYLYGLGKYVNKKKKIKVGGDGPEQHTPFSR